MRIKPIIETAYVIACFEGERPKFMAKDKARGHYVVKLAIADALRFDDEGEAIQALAAFNQVQGWRRAGTWNVYRAGVTTRLEEVALETA